MRLKKNPRKLILGFFITSFFSQTVHAQILDCRSLFLEKSLMPASKTSQESSMAASTIRATSTQNSQVAIPRKKKASETFKLISSIRNQISAQQHINTQVEEILSRVTNFLTSDTRLEDTTLAQKEIAALTERYRAILSKSTQKKMFFLKQNISHQDINELMQIRNELSTHLKKFSKYFDTLENLTKDLQDLDIHLQNGLDYIQDLQRILVNNEIALDKAALLELLINKNNQIQLQKTILNSYILNLPKILKWFQQNQNSVSEIVHNQLPLLSQAQSQQKIETSLAQLPKRKRELKALMQGGSNETTPDTASIVLTKEEKDLMKSMADDILNIDPSLISEKAKEISSHINNQELFSFKKESVLNRVTGKSKNTITELDFAYILFRLILKTDFTLQNSRDYWPELEDLDHPLYPEIAEIYKTLGEIHRLRVSREAYGILVSLKRINTKSNLTKKDREFLYKLFMNLIIKNTQETSKPYKYFQFIDEVSAKFKEIFDIELPPLIIAPNFHSTSISHYGLTYLEAMQFRQLKNKISNDGLVITDKAKFTNNKLSGIIDTSDIRRGIDEIQTIHILDFVYLLENMSFYINEHRIKSFSDSELQNLPSQQELHSYLKEKLNFQKGTEISFSQNIIIFNFLLNRFKFDPNDIYRISLDDYKTLKKSFLSSIEFDLNFGETKAMIPTDIGEHTSFYNNAEIKNLIREYFTREFETKFEAFEKLLKESSSADEIVE